MHSSPETFPVHVIAPFIPLLLVSALLVIFILSLARRKGRSQLLCVLGFVPIANMFVTLWLASLTDRAVLDQLEDLKRRVAGGQPR